MDYFKFYELKKAFDPFFYISDEDSIKLMLKKVFEGERMTVVEKCSEKCVTIMHATTIKLVTSLSSTYELLMGYNEAIAYAPNDSAELGRAYGNRSAILCNAQLYEDSIKDIDRALGLNYPDNLKSKLYIRKAKNLLALGSEYKLAAEQTIAEARHWMEKLSDVDKSTQEIKLKKLCKQNSFKEPFKKPDNSLILPDIVDPHEQLIGASKAIELEYSEKFGRHFVATRDIKPGETLVKTQAYAIAHSESFNYFHCWYCGKRVWAGIPCKNCIIVMYCDEKCRDEAWNNFHDIECLILSIIPVKKFRDAGIMGMRIIVKSLKEAGSVALLEKIVKTINSRSDPVTKGFTEGKLDGSKYASIHTLNNCRSKLVKSFRSIITSISAQVMFVWATRTEIFGMKINKFDEFTSNESILFMTKLLMQTIIICTNNSFRTSFDQEGKFIDAGAILSCLTSYFNHSCDPNAFVVHFGDLIGIRSTQKIIKGQQIFVSYAKRYHQLSTIDRQRNLELNFGFWCDCHACEGNWGPNSQWPSIYKQLLPSEVMTNLSKAFDDFEKHFKDVDIQQKENLISTELRYITLISELLTILCEEAEYPAKEITWLKNMLILNYRNNSY